MYPSIQYYSPSQYVQTIKNPHEISLTPTRHPRNPTSTPHQETQVPLPRSLRRRTLLTNGADNTFQDSYGSPRNLSDFDSSPLGHNGEILRKGAGNLADELAGFWDGEEGVGTDDDGEAFESDWEGSPRLGENEQRSRRAPGSAGDVGSPLSKIMQVNQTFAASNCAESEEILKQKNYVRGDHHTDVVDYAPIEISPSLDAYISEIEAVVNQYFPSTNVTSEIPGLAKLLSDIGSQSHLETTISSYINTHTSMTTTLLQNTRLITSLSSILFSPFSTINVETADLDNIFPSSFSASSISSALSSNSKSQSSLSPQHQLVSLSNTTASIISTLSNLTDALYIEHEISTTFARHLRNARELVGEMKKEEEASQAGQKWLNDGGWHERLKGRESGRRCAEWVKGFEEVCGGWRERLIAGAV